MNPGSDNPHKRQKAYQTIPEKIRQILRPGYESFLEDSTFRILPSDTEQLKALQKAEAQPVTISDDDTANILVQSGGEEKVKLLKYDITSNHKRFLGLVCRPKAFYVREGYEELYKYVHAQWNLGDREQVILLGNAGTGKSWFQIYALKQLMSSDNKEFDFVIRQVDKRLNLIDLEEAVVYEWKTDSFHILSDGMERALYFFEPGNDPTTPPLNVPLPSLSTLSPNIERIKEYEKGLCLKVYFWPWSPGELWAVIRDSNLGIDEDTFSDRYHKFGGVLRHVLGQVSGAEKKLESHLFHMDIDILTSKGLDIDRDKTGCNVSGFLVCYDNRSIQGEDRFATVNLEFTSAYVEEAVQTKIIALPARKSMKIMLDRLSGAISDISGKNLERVAMELLSHGKKFKWVRKEIGENQASWERFVVSKERTIVRDYDLSGFRQANKIIAPTNRTFPVIDFVFSLCSKDGAQEEPPVVGFQCTWGKVHDVKLYRLCTLRRKMKIQDDHTLEINIVCPQQEDLYAERTKESFLDRKLDRDLKLNNQTTLKPPELDTIWRNTKLFVIRPESSWHDQINAYLSTHR